MSLVRSLRQRPAQRVYNLYPDVRAGFAGELTDERLRRAAAYFDTLRLALNLAQWTIVVSDEAPQDDDAAASIAPLGTRHFASVRLSAAYHEASPELQRHYAVHELLHCVLDGLDGAVTDMENAIEETSWRHLRTMYMRQAELAIDDLACLLAPFMPLPPA